jgi:hypothetical protein
MLFYLVTIADAIRGNPLEYRLVQYLAQAPTAASARADVLEHHLARPDRASRAVRWAIVEPKPAHSRVVTVSEEQISLDEIERIERLQQPYVIA